MNDIQEIFKKYWPQTIHIIAIPAFFFIFMMIYTPLGADGYLGDIAPGYSFHLAMLSCIIAAVEGLSRSIMYIFRKRMNKTAYIFWCVMDIAAAALLMGLYIWLVKRRTLPYFSAVGWSFAAAAMTSVYPYFINPMYNHHTVLSFYIH